MKMIAPMLAEWLGNDLQVWFAQVDEFLAAGMYDTLWEVLDLAEKRRAQAFLFPADRLAYILAHGLLRMSLAGYLGVEPKTLSFTCSAQGKPKLLMPLVKCFFNLSHTRGAVAWSVTSVDECGVDIEKVREDSDWRLLATEILSPREVSVWLAEPGEVGVRRLFLAWTLKEALLKADGAGLRILPKEITLHPAADGICWQAKHPGIPAPADWRLVALTVPGIWQLAVCARTGTKRLLLQKAQPGVPSFGIRNVVADVKLESNF